MRALVAPSWFWLTAHTGSLNEKQRCLEAFLDLPLTSRAKEGIEAHFLRRLVALQACTRCSSCEERCPHQVPILGMLEQMLVNYPPLIEAVRKRG